MSVPFEQIGDSQVGRLVYQVIGKDGPIFNPQNIRYLGPGDPGFPAMVPSSSPPLNLSGLATGLAGINLMATIGSVALTAVVLKEVREISKQIDEARTQILGKLDQIYERVKAIDIKVQENNLREALKHLARTCVVDDTIDLMEIKKIEGDVRRFLETVEMKESFSYCRGTPFELSYDVREKLGSLHSFLHKTRETVAGQHNIRVQGNPSQMLIMDYLADYRPKDILFMENPYSWDNVRNVFGDLERGMIELMQKRERFVTALFDLVVKKANPVQQTANQIGEAYARVMQILTKLDERFLPASMSEISWLWNTDMGLLWRVHKELKALGDYKQEFPLWQRIQGKSLGSDELLVDCSWKKPLELPAS